MSLCLHFFFFFLSLSFFLFFLRFYYFCIFALSKGPKWPNTINSWNILPKNTVLEQYSDLPLFVVLELGELEYHIFNPTWPDDMESLIKKKKIGHLVLELGGLEYCSWYSSPSSSGTILGIFSITWNIIIHLSRQNKSVLVIFNLGILCLGIFRIT